VLFLQSVNDKVLVANTINMVLLLLSLKFCFNNIPAQQ